MKEIASSIISDLVEDYRNSSPTRKVILMVSATAVLSAATVVLFRFCSGSLGPLWQGRGLAWLVLTDENGDEWALVPLKGQPLSRFEKGVAKPGPPVVVSTDVRLRGDELSVALIVRGQAGERYVGGARKNGKWQPAPRLKILDEKGVLCASGRFRYG
ncbi:MAG: hypothetical protein ACYS4W_02015 [Planctomycetota bacterium]|jgi:hypothetical protein